MGLVPATCCRDWSPLVCRPLRFISREFWKANSEMSKSNDSHILPSGNGYLKKMLVFSITVIASRWCQVSLRWEQEVYSSRARARDTSTKREGERGARAKKCCPSGCASCFVPYLLFCRPLELCSLPEVIKHLQQVFNVVKPLLLVLIKV